MVDSNVWFDIFTQDPTWYDWSRAAMKKVADAGPVAINPLIFAEISTRFATIEELDHLLATQQVARLALPWEASFLAGKCFVQYRRRGGSRRSPLPDFFIGAHAAVSGLTLLTRDATRYRSYFPKLHLIAPK
ncbi:MAG: type II toxin-antitoxin system VapC family toxin [Planctomycetota bacterium]